MKTPEEIKKLLANRKSCIYDADALMADALAYIRQLERENKDLLEERELNDYLRDKVKQLEAQVPRWISVEERLPEPETEVLVWCGKFVRMACYGHTKSDGLVFWDYDCEGYQDELYPRVTHWMPLPEPPKEG